jgi:PAS domain S-box-containing protein
MDVENEPANHYPWNRVEHLCTALGAAEVGLWDMDLRGRILWRTAEFEKLHGFQIPLVDLAIERITEVVHPEDQAGMRDFFANKLKKSSDVWQYQYRVTWADGSVHWLLSVGHISRDVEGTPLRITGISTDITKQIKLRDEQLLLQRVLEEKNLTLQEILRQMPAGIIVLSVPTGVLLMSNDLGRQILEQNPELRKSADFSRVGSEAAGVPPGTAANFAGRRLMLGEKFYEDIIACKNPQGQIILVELSAAPVRNSAGDIIAGILVFSDVTRRRQVEESIMKSKERLDLVARCTSHVVWEWDLNTATVWRNENAVRFFGGGSGDEPDSYDWWSRRLHNDDRDRVLASVARSIKDRDQQWTEEYRLRRIDGSYANVEDKAAIVMNDFGEPIRVVGAFADISVRKEAEERLRAASLAADFANQAKSQFLANVSHEIRTPLGVIMGFADFILDPDQTIEESRSCAATIRRNSEQLLLLIDELLDLSKIEADHLHLETLPFSVHDLFNELYSLLNFKARSKGIELVIQLDDMLPKWIESDPLRIRQVLINIIGNAIKFTQKGSVTVLVKALDQQDRHLPVTFCISVKDSGIGISAEQGKNLFLPFMQADNSMTRKYGGTGLGLALSRRLARLLHGDVSLQESTPSQGSTFMITFEAKSVDGREDAETKAATKLGLVHSGEPLLGVRVLLVEDALDNQVLVTRLLKRAGAVVVVASSGQEGVERAKTEHFDIVLMDIQMPGNLDGYEATAALRKIGFQKPIIALTAHARPADRERSIQVGFNDHLTKPIDRNMLLETVENFTLTPTQLERLRENRPRADSLH